MNISNRFRSLCLFLIAPFILTVVLVPLAILSKGQSKGQAAVSRQQAEVQAIRRRGGIVLFRPSSQNDLPMDAISVDLRNSTVDAELLQTLSRFTGIERLVLADAKLQSEHYAILGKLPQLQNLSLTGSNFTDESISQLPLRLTSLSLDGTAITDKSTARLAEMTGLGNLTITGTEITPDGLRLLEPMRSLTNLRIDDRCITAESLESLRVMRPQVIEVVVPEGLGQKAYGLLSGLKGSKSTGHHRDGYLLWETKVAWSDALAGVAEAVVLEIGLDSQQAAHLLEAIGNQDGWGRTVLSPLPTAANFWFPSNVPDKGFEIASVDQFIRELQKDPRDFDYWAVRRFAREKLDASNVPQLLTAIREAKYSQSDGLFWFGPFLLVRHGIDNPEVLAELDRMLAHKERFVTVNTICAFGYGGASPFYSLEEWTADKAADEFAVPRLVRIGHDRDEIAARIVLAEIAHRRPEYAAEVLAIVVDLLEEGQWPRYVNVLRDFLGIDISRLAELNPDAAIAVVPRLREMVKQLDEQFAGVAASNDGRRRRSGVLEALSATAHHDPNLANEIALEYLKRMEDGKPAGPFATLLSPETPDANRTVVLALLNRANAENGDAAMQMTRVALASIARKIRDWRATNERNDD